jgi:hypothetical protein
VDLVARSLLGMREPSADRIQSAGPIPAAGENSGVQIPSSDGVPKAEEKAP